jgi:hypothetical protein
MPVIAPLIAGAKIASVGFGTAKGTVKELSGYDFIGLMSRIVIFYVVALIIAKIMETIVFSSQGLSKVASMFGIPLPSNIPEPIRKLFVEGYSIGGINLKWWDLIKLLSVLMVIMEMLQFNQSQKQLGLKPAPTTQGIFILIISALLLVSVPHFVQMIREKKIIGGING